MRTRSPKRMYSVTAWPWASISIARRSAMHAEPTVLVALVRDRAGADDRPRAQIARVRRMGDQLMETESHFPGVRMPERAAVPGHSHGQVDSADLPGGAELVGGYGDGAETRGGFCVNPAKAGLHLRNRVRSQARVVRQHHELHVLERSRGRAFPSARDRQRRRALLRNRCRPLPMAAACLRTGQGNRPIRPGTSTAASARRRGSRA